MRTPLLTFVLLSTLAAAEPIAIDWERAKALHQRVSAGETLSAEDQKYYDEAKRQHEAGRSPAGAPSASNEADPEMRRAKEIYRRKQAGETVSAEDEKFLGEMMRKRGAGGGGNAGPSSEEMSKARDIHQRKEAGQKVTPEEEKFLEEMMRKRGGGGGGRKSDAAASGNPVASAELLKTLVPLTELKADYHGQDGGLYGNGSNEPPAAQAARAQNALAQVQPLGTDGKPAADGKIVMVSLGMSNTTQEFSTFKRLADADARKSDRLVIVDCAQGGQTAQAWATQDRPWDEALRRIDAAGVKPAQVQVLWLKQANAGPSGGFPAATDKLAADIKTDLQRAREKYPNLRLVFLSSRIYAGYATTGLNPEPYAYEGAFAVRDVIRSQPADGPVLLWGPYLWTAGDQGRALDGLKWSREDCGGDGTHPSPSGQRKVAEQLLGFFTSNAYAKAWFVK